MKFRIGALVGSLLLAVMPTAQAETVEPMSMSYYINNVYDVQLRTYYTALLEKWPAELYQQEGRSELGAKYLDGDPLQRVGFTLQDLDGDALPELIIGAISREEEAAPVFEVWSAPGEAVVPLLISGEAERWYLEGLPMGGFGLVQELQGAEEDLTVRYCSIDNCLLRPELAVMYCPQLWKHMPWSLSLDADPDLFDDMPITEELAEAVLEKHRHRLCRVQYLPFYLYDP